jgi:hypothetical protein
LKLRIHWETLTRIALSRFYPTERGQGIRDSEIEGKLKELKNAGYAIDPDYAKMEREKLWQYLRAVRMEIYSKAQEHCPDVLAEMNRVNAQIRQQEELGR